MRRNPPQPGRFFWKLFLGNAALLSLALLVCVALILEEFDRFHDETLTRQLRAQAAALARGVEGELATSTPAEITALAHRWGDFDRDGLRVTFFAADGTPLGDSLPPEGAAAESEWEAVEVREALESGWGQSTRDLLNLPRRLRYVAVRIGSQDDPEGVVRVGVPVQRLTEQAHSVRKLGWRVTVVIILAAVALGLGLARLWTRPLRRITVIARRLSRGDLSARARVGGSDELGMLADSLNEMRDHLAGQMETIDRQRRTLEALLSQLREGVIVAGPDGRIELANPAAVRMLHPAREGDWPDPASWRGKTVEACVPQHDLQQALLPLNELNASGAPIRSDLNPRGGEPGTDGLLTLRISVQGPRGTTALQAHASDLLLPRPLRLGAVADDEEDTVTGRIVALSDITELVRTLQVKSDFVGNASHELRTPITAIRASLDTLRQLDLGEAAESGQRFLDVIERHCARLEALAKDLLNLAQLESGSVRFEPASLDLGRVLRDLQGRWQEPAEERGLDLRVPAPAESLKFVASPHLLEMVLDNLVDNAIKYTDEGQVEVISEVADHRLEFQVRDTGQGIPDVDQARVFERFYQVERARSGVVRGTGLGLSIVRHAVAAMRGRVVLESTEGKGTCVTVHLPIEASGEGAAGTVRPD